MSSTDDRSLASLRCSIRVPRRLSRAAGFCALHALEGHERTAEEERIRCHRSQRHGLRLQTQTEIPQEM